MPKNSDEQLNNLRHSAAHLLAHAVKLLYPGALNAIGPAIENGFYQDFDMGKHKISEEDLPKIEAKMREILPAWQKFTFNEVTLAEAKRLFKDNKYKVEMATEFAKEGKKLQINDPGDFLDLCKMGHVDNPSKELQNFKLLKIAGAYWRGNEQNKMLTRIYGTAWPTQEELDKYLQQLNESEKRDHRKLGVELDLFAFSDLVGPGLPLFTPKGTLIRKELENFVKSLQEPLGYQQVLIPHLAKVDLYKTSGHWFKFRENMFSFVGDDLEEKFALKPMNCPHHIELFKSRQRSYRDLPQRYAEVTACYRNEKVGELLGLSRVYMLTQDDAHVFCTEEQAIEECLKVYSIVKNFYAAFDFGMSLKVRMSLRDPQRQEKYLGDKQIWDKAEQLMRQVASEAGLEVYDGVGEAAFYGPKLDFMAFDSLGRQWQLATIQLDFNFPERFDLVYIDKDGQQKRPVIIHRAILGSVERFMSILIEHYAGAFPTWLSPTQAIILPIADRHLEYASVVNDELINLSVRSEVDSRSETLNSKIRDAQIQKIPYMIIVGDKEVEAKKTSVRSRDRGDLGQMDLKKFIDNIKIEIEEKRIV